MAAAAGGGEVVIETATAADHDELADLYLASRADALAYLRRVHSDEDIRAWIGWHVLAKGVTWVARARGRIVGFLNLQGEDLDQLYLLPGFYRQGVGTRLLAMAKAASPRRLELYTFQRNTRARAFYESHGFTARRFGDGTGNEEGEPDVFYVWESAD